MTQAFHVEMIKPSHYDDEGHVIQWWKASIPSNSLASLHAIVQDVADRRVLRAHLEKGVARFFITDDDFARNRHWQDIPDRIIALREQETIPFRFLIQVGALAYRIPNFIEKCRRAGCCRVLISLETINPGNLPHARKRRNKIREYRRMPQAWRQVPAVWSMSRRCCGAPSPTGCRRVIPGQPAFADRMGHGRRVPRRGRVCALAPCPALG